MAVEAGRDILVDIALPEESLKAFPEGKKELDSFHDISADSSSRPMIITRSSGPAAEPSKRIHYRGHGY